MKLFIVTCVKEYQETVATIFTKASIHVFSASDTSGFKDNNGENLLDEGFAAGKERFDSIVLFSFTTDANADLALKLIVEHNVSNTSQFPIRAFIVPVEKSSY